MTKPLTYERIRTFTGGVGPCDVRDCSERAQHMYRKLKRGGNELAWICSTHANSALKPLPITWTPER